jgi:hypothetical protein
MMLSPTYVLLKKIEIEKQRAALDRNAPDFIARLQELLRQLTRLNAAVYGRPKPGRPG